MKPVSVEEFGERSVRRQTPRRPKERNSGGKPMQADGEDQAAARQAAEERDPAVHLEQGTLQLLSLPQRSQVQFTDNRSRAIAELCGASEAAIGFIRDLVASPYTALKDNALHSFLDERLSVNPEHTAAGVRPPGSGDARGVGGGRVLSPSHPAEGIDLQPYEARSVSISAANRMAAALRILFTRRSSAFSRSSRRRLRASGPMVRPCPLFPASAFFTQCRNTSG